MEVYNPLCKGAALAPEDMSDLTGHTGCLVLDMSMDMEAMPEGMEWLDGGMGMGMTM